MSNRARLLMNAMGRPSAPSNPKKFIVRIIKGDPRFGTRDGDEFEAIRYWLDPRDKWTLLRRVSDGFDPDCNEYASNVEVVGPA